MLVGTLMLAVNGGIREVSGDPSQSLLRVLRGQLQLRGTKYGCGEGACGACTVLLDGEPHLSCSTSVADVGERQVTTIEGLAPAGRLHPVQAALLAEGGLQCGFCTPGMVLAAAALLARDPSPDELQIRTALNGHICRCGTYSRILKAVAGAAGQQTTAMPPPGPSTPHPQTRVPNPFDLTPALQRPYFDLLSDGLVAVLPGAPPPSSGPRWADGGAFVHVGSTGVVTAFIGKVDGGQDNRTALAQLVAEELRVDLSRVVMVMGDTDISPFDMGTFGSRSMPDAGLHLRLVSVAARRGLLELARARIGGVEDDQLVDGWVHAADQSLSVSYGDLVEGLNLVLEAGRHEELTPPSAWTIAGEPAPRVTSPAAVSGTKVYPSDFVLPGMLEGRTLSHPFHGAELRSVDLTRAEQVEGVQVIREGDLVGAVGEDGAQVSRAIAAVLATWSPGPTVTGATLSGYLRDHPVQVDGWGGSSLEEAGDVEGALQAGGQRLAATYTIPYIAHVPMEPRSAVARWSGDTVTVWTGTQRPFAVRHELAEALAIEESLVEVVVPDFGGGFGGKHTGEAAAAAAILARRAGRPVRVAWSRAEEFTQAYLRPAAVIDVSSATAPDGAIAAWEFTNLNSGPHAIQPPYAIPNWRLRFQPAASPLRQGSYRALAATANNFARESHIDELAHLVGEDPLGYRLRQLSDRRLAEVLERVAERAGWQGRNDGGGHGLGLAVGLEKDGRIVTCAEVQVHPDQRLELIRLVTGFDCGAIVSPANLANQVEGAVIMGLGGALFEAIEFADGEITNASLRQYRVPRFLDVPPIEVVLVDRPEVEPAGAGETPIMAVAPALANAIFAATGRRLRDLPLTPQGRLA